MGTVFAPELEGLDRAEIKRWYNGYCWRGQDKLYNPFDVLLLFRTREFDDYWFETGSPTMLYRQIAEEGVNRLLLERMKIDAQTATKFDINDIELPALMFQSGYLTIEGEESRGTDTYFSMDFPNYEVRQSFSKGLLKFTGVPSIKSPIGGGHDLLESLAALDFDAFC